MTFPQTFYDPEKRIWSGPEVVPRFHPDVSLGQVILFMLDRSPDHIGQISDNEGVSLTNYEIKNRTLKIFKYFEQQNLKQGEILGIVAKNTQNLAPLVFASFLYGTPISTLDSSFNEGEIVHMFGITKPKFVFCDDDNYETVKIALEKLNSSARIFTVRGNVKGVPSIQNILDEISGDSPNFIPPRIPNGSETTAAIICSSGTTGLPKAVCMSHAILLQQSLHLFQATTDDVFLCFSSLYWLSGLGILISGTMRGSTRIITDKPFAPELLLRLVEKYKVTILLTPPSQLVLCLQCPDIKVRNLDSVRIYACGGSLVPTAAFNEMNTYLKNGYLAVGYGMSEISGCATFNVPDFREKSVGQVAENNKLKIIDSKGSLGPGCVGEICIKPYYKFLGYFNNPKATREMVDDEGWIHSGDLGYFDNDGWLYIVDRIKEILKYKNFHIYPFEIEEVIAELPGVSQVCVVGVPDLIYTDLPAAGVVLAKGHQLSEEEICRHVELKMSDFKRLRGGVYFFDSLPFTASGKVKKREIRDAIIKRFEERKIIKQG